MSALPKAFLLLFHKAYKETAISKLNPITKVVLVLTVSVVALMIDHPVWMLILLALDFILVVLARVPKGFFKIYATFLGWFCVFFFVILSLLGRYGGHIYLYHAVGYVSDRNILMGASVAMKFLVMSVITGVFIYTTTQRDVFYGLRSLPYLPFSISLAVALAFRCLVLFANDFLIISEAQMSRALDFSKGNIIQRLRKFLNIWVPLMFISIKRMEELTNAIESKAFTIAKKRSCYFSVSYKPIDWVVIFATIVFLVNIGILRYVFGYFTLVS